MRIAAKVRLEKEKNPERFCADKRCLWRVQTRTGPRPCPKHGTKQNPCACGSTFHVVGGACLTCRARRTGIALVLQEGK